METTKISHVLKNLNLFKNLPKHTLDELALHFKTQNYASSETIIEESCPFGGFFLILKGKAIVMSKKMLKIFAYLERGDYFGAYFFTSSPLEDKSKAAVIAEIPTTVLFLSKANYWVLQPQSQLSKSPNQSPFQKILSLEQIEVDLTRAQTPPEGHLYKRVFGGQLLAQALASAYRSVEPTLRVHSLHSYFLVAGDPNIPIVYRVERIRDGQSFATRHVVAVQKGRNIFSMHASFQVNLTNPEHRIVPRFSPETHLLQKEEIGLEHQIPMPSGVPAPDTVPSWDDIQNLYFLDPRIPMDLRRRHSVQPQKSTPVDLRFCDPVDWVDPKRRDPRQLVWMKTKGNLPEDHVLHCCAVAYSSDFSFLDVALLPHGLQMPNQNLIMASLDHCMWFHKPVKADSWLLYQVESPRSSGSRGYCLGRFYNMAGELVVSVAQEGLIRMANGGEGVSENKARL